MIKLGSYFTICRNDATIELYLGSIKLPNKFSESIYLSPLSKNDRTASLFPETIEQLHYLLRLSNCLTIFRKLSNFLFSETIQLPTVHRTFLTAYLFNKLSNCLTICGHYPSTFFNKTINSLYKLSNRLFIKTNNSLKLFHCLTI